MDIVTELLKEKEKRLEYFKRYAEYAKKIKLMAEEVFGKADAYVFGSTVRGDYHPILSDIDVAIVVEEKDRGRELELKVKVTRFFGDVFEIHVLDNKQWEFYKRFSDVWVEVE
jgi:predicted nucleotidyltransferase